MIWRDMKAAGVLGINARNASFTLAWNKRSLYPRVDDKHVTKELCAAAGIAIPRLLAVARIHFELRALRGTLESLDSFVLKPARGAMGNGIVVVNARESAPGARAARWVRAGGRALGTEDLIYHAAGIISGLYAIGGQPDVALLEERLELHRELRKVAFEGVPDCRVIVFRGIPVMSMIRLPTHRSGGRANLHQGAIGAGIDLASGRTTHAILKGDAVRRHPDTDERVVGLRVPHFDQILETAVRATDTTELGYVGADIVVDERYGPVVLELNARPGLAIQAANRAGLKPRLGAVMDAWRPGLEPAERVAHVRAIALAHPPRGLES
jgi:alpha-L-glutamate ligase-like protein